MHRTGRSYAPQGKRVKDQTFAFDRVFDDTTSQADIYESTAKPLLDNVLDGYNATVFAYGATGCGKTHTITCVLLVIEQRGQVADCGAEERRTTPESFS